MPIPGNNLRDNSFMEHDPAKRQDPLPVTEGERSLHRWQYRLAGDFERHLWSTIAAADSTNLRALARAFPEHVCAYVAYTRVPGWWDALKGRIEAGE